MNMHGLQIPEDDRDRLQHMLEAAQKAIELATDRTSAELKAMLKAALRDA